MKKNRISFAILIIGLFIFFPVFRIYGSGTSAQNAKFPQKAVTIVCPYGAGGGTDLAMRIMGEYAGKYLGQSVVVENKTGGAGSIGMLAVLDSRRDGYTLGSATADLITIPLLGITDRISLESFEVIGAVNGEPAAIIVRTDSPWNSLKDFLEDARKRPGQITLANAGAGNIWHLSALGLEDATGTSFNHVPYQDGAAAALTGLMGGHVDAAVCSVAEASANIASGSLKALAIAGDKRLDAFPSVPTYKEEGIDLVILAIRGVCVASDVPEAEKAILKEAFKKGINDPECKQKILGANMTYMPLDAEELKTTLVAMRSTFEKAVAIYNRQK
jgi:tripartite-type tricarboxylate transporter receptor subunit TctC